MRGSLTECKLLKMLKFFGPFLFINEGNRQWRIQGRGPGPNFESNCGPIAKPKNQPPPPSYLRVWRTPPPLPKPAYLKVCIRQ